MTFEELYKHELDQRERLRAAVSVPLGLLIVIGSLLGVMLQSFWVEAGILGFVFYLAVIGSAWFFVRTMYFLARSYHGHVYKAMPLALERWRYRDQLRDWHTKYGTGPEAGDQEFGEYLERLYAEAADHNAGINLAKSEYLFRANQSIVRCAIFTVFAFVPFTVHRGSTPNQAQKVEIINRPRVIIDQEDKMPGQSTPVQQQPPPKPPAPPLRDLKEGQIPKKK
jgi:hypothetical protein